MKRLTFILTCVLAPLFATAQTDDAPFGDLNNDGVTNTADVMAIYNYIITGEKPGYYLYYTTSDNKIIDLENVDKAPAFSNANGEDVVLKNEFLGEGKGCRLTLSEPVTRIMGLDHQKITKITIPNSVTQIGSGAFYDYPFTLTLLDTIIIPNSVTFIGPEAFERCYNLRYAKVGSGLKDALGHLFADCGSLNTVEFDGSNLETINSGMYANTDRYWSIFDDSPNVKHIRFGTLRKLNFIASNTFSELVNLEELRMPDMSISFDISDCTSLSRGALVTLFKDLATVSTTQSITLGDTNLSKLKQEDIDILTAKGWNAPGWVDDKPIKNKTFTVNGVTFNMIAVEGGTFQMGSTYIDDKEKPIHYVTLSNFYIGETEVTQALYEAVMGSNPSLFKGDDLPVEKVSWTSSQTFIAKLNELTNQNFSLPTEAEWEFAAMGGNKSKNFTYSGSNTLDEVAWYANNSSSKTHPVAQKLPNELGIYDMVGNVNEWCQDWYGSYNGDLQINPTGPESGSERVLRGQCWSDDSLFCNVKRRSSLISNYGVSYVGLRLALSSRKTDDNPNDTNIENLVTAPRTGTSQTVTSSGTYYGVTWTITNSSSQTIHVVSVAGNTDIACDIAAGASKDIQLYGSTAYIQNYMQKLVFTAGGKQYEKQI